MDNRNEKQGIVYLLHFSRSYKHAKHYLGFAIDFEERIEQHENGNGSRLTQVIKEEGITFEVVRIWSGDRHLERKLKNLKNSPKLCPVCNASL